MEAASSEETQRVKMPVLDYIVPGHRRWKTNGPIRGDSELSVTCSRRQIRRIGEKLTRIKWGII